MITVYNTHRITGQTVAITCDPEQFSKSKAVEIIETAYRDRRSTIDLLQEQSVKTLSHSKFKRLIFLISRRERKRCVTETYVCSLNEVLVKLAESRFDFHKTHPKIPIFRIRSAENGLPQIKALWVDSSRIDEFPQRKMIKMTQCSLKPYRSLKRCKVTKEMLNFIHAMFAQMDSLAWNYKPNGCADRTNVMLLYFRALKVSDQRLRIAFIVGPNLKFTTEKGTILHWKYHVAPLVTDIDGLKWVIDPLVSPEGVLTRHEWAAKIHSGVSDYSFRAYDSITPKSNEKISFYTYRNSAIKLGYEEDKLIIKVYQKNEKYLYSACLPRFSKWHFLAECTTFTALERSLTEKLGRAAADLKPFLTDKIFLWLEQR